MTGNGQGGSSTDGQGMMHINPQEQQLFIHTEDHEDLLHSETGHMSMGQDTVQQGPAAVGKGLLSEQEQASLRASFAPVCERARATSRAIIDRLVTLPEEESVKLGERFLTDTASLFGRLSRTDDRRSDDIERILHSEFKKGTLGEKLKDTLSMFDDEDFETSIESELKERMRTASADDMKQAVTQMSEVYTLRHQIGEQVVLFADNLDVEVSRGQQFSIHAIESHVLELQNGTALGEDATFEEKLEALKKRLEIHKDYLHNLFEVVVHNRETTGYMSTRLHLKGDDKNLLGAFDTFRMTASECKNDNPEARLYHESMDVQVKRFEQVVKNEAVINERFISSRETFLAGKDACKDPALKALITEYGNKTFENCTRLDAGKEDYIAHLSLTLMNAFSSRSEDTPEERYELAKKTYADMISATDRLSRLKLKVAQNTDDMLYVMNKGGMSMVLKRALALYPVRDVGATCDDFSVNLEAMLMNAEMVNTAMVTAPTTDHEIPFVNYPREIVHDGLTQGGSYVLFEGYEELRSSFANEIQIDETNADGLTAEKQRIRDEVVHQAQDGAEALPLDEMKTKCSRSIYTAERFMKELRETKPESLGGIAASAALSLLEKLRTGVRGFDAQIRDELKEKSRGDKAEYFAAQEKCFADMMEVMSCMAKCYSVTVNMVRGLNMADNPDVIPAEKRDDLIKTIERTSAYDGDRLALFSAEDGSVKLTAADFTMGAELVGLGFRFIAQKATMLTFSEAANVTGAAELEQTYFQDKAELELLRKTGQLTPETERRLTEKIESCRRVLDREQRFTIRDPESFKAEAPEHKQTLDSFSEGAERAVTSREEEQLAIRSSLVTLRRRNARIGRVYNRKAGKLEAEARKQRDRATAERIRQQEEEERRRLEAERIAMEDELERIRLERIRITDAEIRRTTEDGTVVRNSVMTSIQGSLDMYVPKDAVGRLDDYVVDHKKVEGVGKTRVFFEKTFGGISSSKLNRRIGMHVERFLHSVNITDEQISQTGTSVVDGAGLFSRAFTEKCAKAGLFGASGFNTTVLGEKAAVLNLLKKVNDSADGSDLDLSADELALLPEFKADELPLAAGYFTNYPYAKKAILLGKLAQKLNLSALYSNDRKLQAEFADRLRATKDNLAPLYNAVVSSAAYKSVVLERKEADVRARHEANLRSFNELQPSFARVSADETPLDHPEQVLETLRRENQMAVESFDRARRAVEYHETDRILASEEQQRLASEAERKQRIAALRKTMEEKAAAQKLERLKKQRTAFIRTGDFSGVAEDETWVLGPYEQVITDTLKDRFLSLPDTDFELMVRDMNKNVRQNRRHLERYLDRALAYGKDYHYLVNETFRQKAKEGIVRSLGGDFLKEYDEDAFASKMRFARCSSMFKEYRELVKKVKSEITSDKELAPYEESLLANEEALSVLVSDNEQEIHAYLDRQRRALEVNEEVVKKLVSSLPGVAQEARMTALISRLRPLMLTSTPDMVMAAAKRELEYLELLNTSGSAEISELAGEYRRLRAEGDEAIDAASEEIFDRLFQKIREMDFDQYEEDSHSKRAYEHGRLSSWQLLPQEDCKRFVKDRLYLLKAKGELGSLQKLFIRDKAWEIFEEYASSQDLEYRIEKLHHDKGGEGVTEYDELLSRKLFEAQFSRNEAEGFRDSLMSEQVFIIDCVKKLAKGGAEHFGELKVAEVLDIIEEVNVRLSILGMVFEESNDYYSNEEVRRKLLEKTIGSSDVSFEMLLDMAKDELIESKVKGEALRFKSQVLHTGVYHGSKRLYVDLFSQKKTSKRRGDDEFRAVNRFQRIRSTDTDADDKFGEARPVSFYEYVASKRIETVPDETELAKLRDEWKKKILADAKGNKALTDFINSSILSTHVGGYRDSVYYGVKDISFAVVAGVSESINEDKREVFEGKLEIAALEYHLRRNKAKRICESCHLDEETTAMVLANFEKEFVRQETDTSENYDEAFAQRVSELAHSLSLKDRYGNDKEGLQLEDRNKLIELSRRKDERIEQLKELDEGIYTPLIPILMENSAFTDALVGDSAEHFAQKLSLIRENCAQAMTILTTEKGAFHTFIDQYLIRFGDEIIAGRLKGDSVKKAFEAYYKELMAIRVTEKRTVGDIISDAIAVKGRKGEPMVEGNILLQIMLYEGALEMANTEKVKAYMDYYKENKKVFDDEIKIFFSGQSFLSYVEFLRQNQGNVSRVRNVKKAAEHSFRTMQMLQEREYILLTKDPNSYRLNLRRRMEVMLSIQRARMESVTLTKRMGNETKSALAHSVLAAKRRGREMYRADKEALRSASILAGKKVSPVAAADGVTEITESKRRTLSRMYRMLERSGTSERSKKLTIDVITAEVVRGHEYGSDELLCICRNIERITNKLGSGKEPKENLALIRTLMKADSLTRELSEAELDAMVPGYTEELKTGEALEGIRRLREALPKDGSLSDYYSLVLTKALYVAAERDSVKLGRELDRLYVGLSNRINLLEAIGDFIGKRKRALKKQAKTDKDVAPMSEGEALKLRAGLYDLYGEELFAEETIVDSKTLRRRIENRFKEENGGSAVYDYVLDDRGPYASISSSDAPADYSVLSDGATRYYFERMLEEKGSGSELARYVKLSPEEKVVFGILAGSGEIKDLSGVSFSLSMGAELLKGSDQGSDVVASLKDYVEGRELTMAPNYSTVCRLLFAGGRLDESYMREVLDSVDKLRVRRLRANVDFNLLGNSAEETIRLTGRKLPDLPANEAAFKETCSALITRDSGEDTAALHMLEQLQSLRTYEFNLLCLILSDRTALDESLLGGVVNKKRRDELEKGIRSGAGSLLSREPVSEAVVKRAFTTLCSTQIRDDREIYGELTRADLVEDGRSSMLDMKLLKSGLEVLMKLNSLTLVVDTARAAVHHPTGLACKNLRERHSGHLGSERKLLRMLRNEAKKDHVEAVMAEVEELSEDEKSLLFGLLRDRWLVDETSAEGESGRIDEEGFAAVSDEFMEKGRITINPDGLYESVFESLTSSAINDEEVRAGGELKLSEVLREHARATAIDWELVTKALLEVRGLSSAYLQRSAIAGFSPLAE